MDAQWSPFSARDYWVISTANHRAIVWNLNLRDDSPSGAVEHSLQGHNRAITDLNFSAHHPDLLSTCSVDGYVHCWDLRRPRQPTVTFCDWFSGATQVKYNRQDPSILASSHDRWLHIWDERRPSEPLRSINAHDSKIYGIDWNRVRSTAVVTCSLDKSIKYWDYSRADDTPERVIRTDFPVWRARHTPFGNGLLAMPQTDPGDLYLYHNTLQPDTPVDGHVRPTAVFPGHGSQKAKEFLWRSRGNVTQEGQDDREFQLVSWGADNELRLQSLDASISKSIDYVKGGAADTKLSLTRQGAVYRTFRSVDDGIHKERRDATMSDPRTPLAGSKHYQSALTQGVRSIPMNRNRLGATWSGTSMTAKSGSKGPKGSLAQIGWMKGVNMTKRKASAANSKPVPRRYSSKDAAMFGPGYLNDEWGEPETIQDEVLRISQQLPKVKWETVNMEELTLEASLNGPWGADNASIFFKVKVDIPVGYPKSKAPKFSIEKTALMPSSTHKKVESETQKLAQRFMERKQNCLDFAFTYLLGDVDLESSISFFKNVKDFDDDDIDGLADESSSEDEDSGMAGGGSASMSQELTSSVVADNSLAPTNRVPIPPPPRLCGARFSHDGRLVCFFPTKEEKAKALFTSPEGMKERAKGEPFFPGFGRMIPESPMRNKYPDDTSATEDQSDSDESGGSSTSSTDSESMSMHKSSLWYHPGRSLGKTWSGTRSIRSSGGGTGVGTGTGTGTNKKRAAKPRNVVSVHDIRNDLPSKKEFAQEYLIFGDGGEVCSHNARVAEKYGRSDLVDIWNYAGLLLRKGIPLELVNPDRGQDSVLVIARDVMARLHGAETTDDASGSGSVSSFGGDSDETGLAGRAKWGTHPLATEFVRDMLAYFEQLADVQMLAMLSCIFGESTAEGSVAYMDSHITQPETPLPLKAPSFSLDYFPAHVTTLLAAHHHGGRSQPNSAVTTPKTAHTPVRYSGSLVSDDGLWTGEPGSNSYSCGETPPTKPDYISEIDQTQSLSSSPNARPYRRMNSGLASSLAANFPRTFGTQSVSSSPPNQLNQSNQPRKRGSPAETILGNLAPGGIGNITWGSSTVLGDSGGTARTSLSDDEFRDDFISMVPISVSVDVEDQAVFDDDGWLVLPLLDPSQSARYAAYRYAYAEMLHMWNQPLARLEVMKFNVLKGARAGTAAGPPDHDFHHVDAGGLSDAPTTHITPSSPILLGKKEQLQALLSSGRGLDVTGICRVHETQLEPLEYTTSTEPHAGGAVGTCDRCRKTQRQLRCVYCLEPVDALYPPCLSCGCASHAGCLAEWHAAGETVCPAGDECNCVEEASNGQVETWAAMVGALERLKGRRGSIMGNIGARLPTATSSCPAVVDEGEGPREGGAWESVGSAAGIPWRPQGAVASPAKLSLGHRLKRAGDWGRGSRGRGRGRRNG